ncbi:MAG: class III extradiol ring-cleavage dioxygenase, partial [Kiloniellaceae bacterium]
MPSDTATPQPSFFLPHGAGPCFFMDWNPPDAWDRMAAYLKGLAATLPAPPKAILCVSAHWIEPAFTVAGAARPELIFDYSGFPPHTYQLTYPAPGDPALAARVVELLQAAG